MQKEETCSIVADSHFLRSKSTKCMEIVSNTTIMDVSHTMDSYGPSSVLLAVIALLLRGALSAAEIGKAHMIQALCNTQWCVYSKEEWWLSVPDIYDLWLPISSGDGQHNRRTKFTAFKRKMESISTEIKKWSEQANLKQGIKGKVAECCVSNATDVELRKKCTTWRFFKVDPFYL